MKTSTPTPKVPLTPSLKFVVIALVVLLVIGMGIFLAFAFTPSNKKEKFAVNIPNLNETADAIGGTWKQNGCNIQGLRVGDKNDLYLTAKCPIPNDPKPKLFTVELSQCKQGVKPGSNEQWAVNFYPNSQDKLKCT